MDHIGIFKAAHDLQNCIDLADVREKLIAEALPLACPFDDSSNVDQLEGRRHNLLRNDKVRDSSEPIVRYADNAFVGLDRTEWVVGALRCFRHREGIK